MKKHLICLQWVSPLAFENISAKFKLSRTSKGVFLTQNNYAKRQIINTGNLLKSFKLIKCDIFPKQNVHVQIDFLLGFFEFYKESISHLSLPSLKMVQKFQYFFWFNSFFQIGMMSIKKSG